MSSAVPRPPSIWDLLPDSQRNRWLLLLALAPPGVRGLLVVLASLDDITLSLLGQLFSDPVGFVTGVVAGFLIDVAEAGVVMVVDLIVWFFLGGDGKPGVETGPVGLFDVPVLILAPAIDILGSVLQATTAGVMAFNESIAGAIAPLGVAAFPVVVGLVVLETVIAVAASYVVVVVILEAVSLIDIPYVDTGEAIEGLRGLVRATWDYASGTLGRFR